MKLSRLYSNHDKKFPPIDWSEGMNVVFGDIRLPKNLDRDTHNLGKSTVGRLIDFCFLLKRNRHFFLFEHPQLFDTFVFFLEIEIGNGSYLTVKRSVAEASKVSLKVHSRGNQDLSKLSDEEWDHSNLAFDAGRKLLDGMLDWRALKPWSFRNGLGYLLRGQNDYLDVFQLRKFAGPHAGWKPFLAHLIGFDARPISEKYEKEARIVEKETKATSVQMELDASKMDLGRIEGLMALKRSELEEKERSLNAFDFEMKDADDVRYLVSELDSQISDLNERNYALSSNDRRVKEALEEDSILFDPTRASKLFAEAGVYFEGQIKKDFEQLIDFNKAITTERHEALKAELEEIRVGVRESSTALKELNKRRSNLMGSLSSGDIFERYRSLSADVIDLKAEIEVLEYQRKAAARLQELRAELRGLAEERARLQTTIEENVAECTSNDTGRFYAIRSYFNEIVEVVLDRKAVRHQRLWNILRSLHKRVFWAHRHLSGVNDGTQNRTSPGSRRERGEGYPSQDTQTVFI